MDYSDVTYITPGNTLGFYTFKFWPVWGGIGGSKTRDDYMQLDHIYISGKPLILPGFYVSPTAGSPGTGTFTHPLPLSTALPNPRGSAHPVGPTWLSGGTII